MMAPSIVQIAGNRQTTEIKLSFSIHLINTLRASVHLPTLVIGKQITTFETEGEETTLLSTLRLSLFKVKVLTFRGKEPRFMY